MAKRIRAKLVMELLSQGMSVRTISSTRHIAHQSIGKVRDAAEREGVTWEDVRDLGDLDVCKLLFPSEFEQDEACLPVDYDYVHKELQRDGVTLLLLFEEHCDEARERNLAHKSYTTFCRGYRDHVTSRRVTSHIEHKPGQAMEVDWNGTRMHLACEATGEASVAYLFVATLPYSQYSYVEATLDMKQDTWLLCHVHAWEFFGGVAVRTKCDNLKTGVIEHPREGEIVLNGAYEALGRHYMTAIMPTGVRKPKQKASVEGASATSPRRSSHAFATRPSRRSPSSTMPYARSSTSSTRPPSKSGRAPEGSCSRRSSRRFRRRCRRSRSRSAPGSTGARSTSTST